MDALHHEEAQLPEEVALLHLVEDCLGCRVSIQAKLSLVLGKDKHEKDVSYEPAHLDGLYRGPYNEVRGVDLVSRDVFEDARHVDVCKGRVLADLHEEALDVQEVLVKEGKHEEPLVDDLCLERKLLQVHHKAKEQPCEHHEASVAVVGIRDHNRANAADPDAQERHILPDNLD